MKYQALFYQKNNEKIFKIVICCSRDWHFNGYKFFISGFHNYWLGLEFTIKYLHKSNLRKRNRIRYVNKN